MPVKVPGRDLTSSYWYNGDMAKFRRRDFEVTAVRALEETTVETFRGERTARPGDWIITSLSGDRWVLSDVVFRTMYEPLDDEAREMMKVDMMPPIKS